MTSAAGARNVLIAAIVVIAVQLTVDEVRLAGKHRSELNAVHAEEETRAVTLLDKRAEVEETVSFVVAILTKVG